jgi:acetate kinase
VQHILTLNAGSSSIKFSLFDRGSELIERVRGQVEGLGASPRLEAEQDGTQIAHEALDAAQVTDHDSALATILSLLEKTLGRVAIAAVGHRVVHGGVDFSESIVLDDERLQALSRLNPLAPLHQPHNLSGVRAAQRAFPRAMQVACFDTAFHRSHPFVNDTYALPRELYDQGIRRYGFHGLSYEYVVDRLKQIAPLHEQGRVVVMHLGNGASMCAIRDGQSVVLYLLKEKGMTPDEIEDLLYLRSGLKGLSGLSQDMRELEAAGTPESMQAIDYFVFRIRRELGSMAAILSGLDAVVFCGGIGENAWRIRERASQGFEWLGLELDELRNQSGQTVISSDRSRARVFVIKTNEEMTIARHTARLLASAST